MTFLAESNTWEPGIYQWEEADVVQGGAAGIDNVPTRQLANRTLYLKLLVEALGAGKQDADATLAALAALVTAADKIIYATGPDAFATTTLTTFMRTLLDDVDAAAARATLGAAPSASPTFSGIATFWKLANATLFANGGGAEGGQLELERPSSGSTLGGNIVFDLVGDIVRIFEGGGSTRGVSVNIADCAPGAATLLWHSGNDGTGSGLDADLLDGQHASSFAPLASPALTGTPTAPTPAPGTNNTQIANSAFVQAAIAALVASSPAALNTLNELAAALGNDPNFATTITNALGGKLNKAGDAMTGPFQVLSGVMAPNNTGNCGLSFSGDNDTGLANPSDGILHAVVNGTIVSEYIAATNERIFHFGPGNAWTLALQGDGNVVVYNAAMVAVFTTEGAAPKNSPTLTGSIFSDGSQRGRIDALAALDINCATGNYFIKTIAGNSTFTFSNAPAGAYSFTFELTHTSGTVTWPAAVKWPGDIAPTLTAGKTHLFMFVTDDAGARWRGAALANYTN